MTGVTLYTESGSTCFGTAIATSRVDMKTETRGRVFLLDDDELIVSMLARALAGEGYEVRFETDPRGVAEKIRSFSADVVLLDINLPGANGIDLLREFLAQDVARLVVMLSSDSDPKTVVTAFKLGAADYLVKPFELDEVKKAVREAIE